MECIDIYMILLLFNNVIKLIIKLGEFQFGWKGTPRQKRYIEHSNIRYVYEYDIRILVLL